MKTIRVHHILVSKEYEAQDLLRSLQEGKSFEELATRYSTCPSSKQGGDLGDVNPNRLDDDFADAALALKAGETTAKPVRTRFGYHLIKRIS